MKFFVIETAMVNGQHANALVQKDTPEEAQKEFHSFMAYQIDCPGVTYAMSKVIDECGRDTDFSDVWYGNGEAPTNDEVEEEPTE